MKNYSVKFNLIYRYHGPYVHNHPVPPKLILMHQLGFFKLIRLYYKYIKYETNLNSIVISIWKMKILDKIGNLSTTIKNLIRWSICWEMLQVESPEGRKRTPFLTQDNAFKKPRHGHPIPKKKWIHCFYEIGTCVCMFAYNIRSYITHFI